jgi:uncharacterized membrane protein HdeD (DUF308 family)
MIQTLMKNWRLLALCGLLNATAAVIYFMMYDTGPDGPLSATGWKSMVALLSKLTIAAGVCTVLAGLWKSGSGKSWPLVVNGLALGAYGLLPLVWRGPLGFEVFALLIGVMSITFGIVTLAIARTVRRQAGDFWFLTSAGVSSVGFAVAFLALAGGWVELERRAFHPAIFLWLCLYFGFSAICVLGLSLRLRNLAPRQTPNSWDGSSPFRNPKHAH